MKLLTSIITILCFAAMAVSFFLPFYEGARNNMAVQPSGTLVLDIYEAPEIGVIYVYNGLGSLFACFNFLMALAMVITGFLAPRKITMPIVTGSLFLASLLLLQLGNSAGFGQPISDRMLEGYYVFTPAMAVLVICFIVWTTIAKRNQSFE
jgi:hypothetical protein